MEEELFNKADDMDNLLEDIIQEVDDRMYDMYLEVYDSLQQDGVGYLNIKNNENRITNNPCLDSETTIDTIPNKIKNPLIYL